MPFLPMMSRLLRFTESRSSTFTIIVILLLLPRENFRGESDDDDDGDEHDLEYGGESGLRLKSKGAYYGNKVGTRLSSMIVAAAASADDEGRQLRALFISDTKKLLTHIHRFYNSYGQKDPEVDVAFGEARIAADVIYLYPQIFQIKMQAINDRIVEALRKGGEESSGDGGMGSAMTADGVPVYFVDKGLILLGVMGGIVRFPE